MPAARILAILTEIGELTNNARVKELAIELGTLLAVNSDTTIHTDAKLTRLQNSTTRAIVDTEATLEDHIIDLRTSVQGMTQLFKRRITDLEDRDETITGRVHTLANHMMAVEQKVSELAEVVTMLLDQSNANDEDSYSSHSDDQPLNSPYDGN